ncbi:MAG: hypothetical protein M3Z24_07530 [Chloroflexota bacterium]|nr:hypothetical protein [Chloroflexota bacterium]
MDETRKDTDDKKSDSKKQTEEHKGKKSNEITERERVKDPEYVKQITEKTEKH